MPTLCIYDMYNSHCFRRVPWVRLIQLKTSKGKWLLFASYLLSVEKVAENWDAIYNDLDWCLGCLGDVLDALTNPADC